MSVRFITAGTGAGKWAVSWTDGLVAHAMLIKDVAPAVNNTMRFVGLAIKVSQMLNKVATNPPTGGGDKYQAYLLLISSRGALDAHAHAISFGLAGWDHGDDYNTDVEKKAYYRGRIAGDLATSVTSTSEIEGGLTGAVVTSETGVGLFVAGGVALHGAISGGIAAHDLSISVKKLYMLSNAANGASDGNSNSHSQNSSGTPQKYKPSNDAERIGNGHAWGKHKSEFPEIKTQDEFKELIDKIMTSPGSLHKKLLRGREAWFDTKTNTVVIKDPNSTDGGTMFRPKDGVKYFNNNLK
ncbi:MAG: hypothetical protein ABUT20_49220 [Bacteroidota bacterium]